MDRHEAYSRRERTITTIFSRTTANRTGRAIATTRSGVERDEEGGELVDNVVAREHYTYTHIRSIKFLYV